MMSDDNLFIVFISDILALVGVLETMRASMGRLEGFIENVILPAIVPPTVTETVEELPIVEVQIQDALPNPPNHQIEGPADGIQATDWPIYKRPTRHTEFRYYYDKLYAHFNATNGSDRYHLTKTPTMVRITDGRRLVFQCNRNIGFVRNLYLELNDCGYDCGEWIARRDDGRFDRERNYEEETTPPCYR